MITGFDASNYTGVLSAPQQAEVRAQNFGFAMMGCQSEAIARADLTLFRDMGIPRLMVYADVLRRIPSTIQIAKDFGIPDVVIDFEPGCITDLGELHQADTQVEAAGLEPIIYTGAWCWPNTTEFSHRKLHHAAYGTPNFDRFIPYGGWTRPYIWQYSGSNSLPLTNVDLNVMEDAPIQADHTLDFVPGFSGEMQIGHLRITYNDGVPIRRYGSEIGGGAGREAWNFGGAWLWIRHFNDDGTWDAAGHLSATEGD